MPNIGEKIMKYEKMKNEIFDHKDFGKRNPIDIGIECGYSEKDVLEMLETLMHTENNETSFENHSETYYFILRKGTKGILVAVDVNTWETEIVKIIPHFFAQAVFDYNWHMGKWQIKGDMFVWTYVKQKDFLSKELDGFIYWENLKTGKQEKIKINFDAIQSILVTESEIIVIPQDYTRVGDEIIGYGYDGTVRRKRIKYWGGDWLLEGKEKFYGISSQVVCCIDKNFENQKVLFDIGSNITAKIHMVVAGLEEDRLFCYRWKEVSTGLLSFGSQYDKYMEGIGIKKAVSGFSSCYNDSLTGIDVLEGITTKNYQLFQRKICRRNNLTVVSTFNRCLGSIQNNNHGQVVGIYDKDIFIGVCKGSNGEDVLMKIDLQNERTPVVLPVDIQE